MRKYCDHTPQNNMCPAHGKKWREFHNAELREKYGIEAVFYCSIAGCGKFEILKDRNFTDSFWAGIIENTVLLQILLLREKRAKWKRAKYSG